MNRVKKLVLIMLSALLLSGASLALAYNSYPPASEAVQYLPEPGYQQVAAGDLLRKISVKAETIKKNDVEIRTMKMVMRVQIKEIKAMVKHLKQQNGTGLTADDIAQMKTVTANVEQAQTMLKASSGALGREVLQLRAAKRARDGAGVLRNMDDIISIQNERIKALKEINRSLVQCQLLNCG